MQGSKKEMQISLNDLNEEISKPDFKYADKNYYDKLIKLKVSIFSICFQYCQFIRFFFLLIHIQSNYSLSNI